MRSFNSLAGNHLGRRQLNSLFFWLLGVLAAYKVAAYIIAEDNTSLSFVGLAFAGGVLILTILNDWTKGIYLCLAWLLFEDFARKFLGNNMAVYFAKDVLILVVYLSFFVSWRKKDRPIE